MKTKYIKAKTKESWALPGEPISLDEFKAGIKVAEKGPFYTVGESKQMLEEWRKKRNIPHNRERDTSSENSTFPSEHH